MEQIKRDSLIEHRRIILRVAWLVLAAVLPLVLLGFTLTTLASNNQPHADANEQPGRLAYLPAVFSTMSAFKSPAGVYDCLEYEFGLIWTSEVITLNPDGSSIYNYAPPYSGIVSGTWVYTPTDQLVGFTNFRWLTATYTAPDQLSARRYLPNVDFEIALSCHRQAPSH